MRARADPCHEVPPAGVLTAQYRRATPYIYSDKEIADLIGAAQRLRGNTDLRACTYSTLLALLAVTGMRSSEPLRLDRNDVDLASGVLTVRTSKFGKSRCLPIHESTAPSSGRLCGTARSPLPPIPSIRPSSSPSAALGSCRTRCNRRLSNCRSKSACGTGRIRGARACMICATDSPSAPCCGGTARVWMSSSRPPRLATYLGHVHVSDTYWYLTATPELLQLAARRLDRTTRRPA